MIIAKLTFILKNWIRSILPSTYPLFDVPIIVSKHIFFSNMYSYVGSHTFSLFTFIYISTATPHAECTLRPILARFVVASISRMPLVSVGVWLRDHQVSRERSRSYGRQFGGTFSLHFSIWTTVCRSISSFIWHGSSVAGMSNELTKKKKYSAFYYSSDVLTFAGNN